MESGYFWSGVSAVKSEKSRLFLNGKFLKGKSTAVNDVGKEFVRAIDEILAENPDHRFAGNTTLALRRGTQLDWEPKNLKIKMDGYLIRHLWEQIDLPIMAGGAPILNFCNLGPMATSNAVTVIHDAHVYETPESYSKAFVAYYRLIYSQIGKRHKKIGAISEYSKNALVANGVTSADRIIVTPDGLDHVLRDGCDPSVLAKLNLQPEGYVLALSNAYLHKNVRVLAEAFMDETLSDLKLVVFGSDGREQFEEAGIPVPPNLVFAGRVSNEERRALYESALGFGFPSRVEGFGLPPGEALLLGCPVIAAPCTAIPEVCGDAATYADPDDPQTWINEILDLKSLNADARANRIQAGQEQARKFTWRGSAEKLLNLV